MKDYNIVEIVKKLIGHIGFAGESNYDHDSIANLDEMDELIYQLIEKLCDNVRHSKNHGEDSIVSIRLKSIKMLKDYKELIDNTLDND